MTREQMRANRAKIKQVPCPQCKVPVGAPCKMPGGSNATIPHQARRHAAAQAGVYTP